MGSHPYWYLENYDGDVKSSLESLRDREFRAGRYYPVISHLSFPLGAHPPSPGAQHPAIEDALAEAAQDGTGTRSILDLDHVSDVPDVFAVAPLSVEELGQLYGTTTPTREMVEKNLDFLGSIDRGQGVYILLYEDGRPEQILFAGYSFD
ncbi:MAG: hypothetical protein ACK50J_00175 [Planctomyces sp.]|jgi:hypothetical protein